MKEFTTAVTKTQDEDDPNVEEWLDFKVDDEVWKIAKEPDPTQLALLMAAFGRYASDRDKAAGIIDFFVGVVDEETHQRAVDRLLNPRDKFGIDNIEKILRWYMEETAGRPTAQQPA